MVPYPVFPLNGVVFVPELIHSSHPELVLKDSAEESFLFICFQLALSFYWTFSDTPTGKPCSDGSVILLVDSFVAFDNVLYLIYVQPNAHLNTIFYITSILLLLFHPLAFTILRTRRWATRTIDIHDRDQSGGGSVTALAKFEKALLRPL
jgi:hypothetical protein